VYDNADSVVHNVSSTSREFYAGKCAGMKELKDAFFSLQKEIDMGKEK
jgi:hypothetical protein